MSAVLRMVIGLNAYLEHEEIFILPVLSMLPKFSALRSLKLVDLKITELPSQPTLTQLILTNSKFTTYSGFIRSMTGLGNLRNLELWGTTWGRALPGQPSTVPPIILDSLHLCIFDEPPEDELIPFNVVDSSHIAPRVTDSCGSSARIDFSQNLGLQDLEIHDALGFHVATGEIYDVFGLESVVTVPSALSLCMSLSTNPEGGLVLGAPQRAWVPRSFGATHYYGRIFRWS
ncbi:hypothetical protein FB45DRAFT_1030236 [Roridomyces roridus]|uniref:Uncharacterized protein n=1 Tax=Roridomyces roridus TaxID=1738132 RepID=A0AAD7FKY9_9AGAR|nr:hypothetical protein FB45DRAFT_1030236 [Roridomyces roridus]